MSHIARPAAARLTIEEVKRLLKVALPPYEVVDVFVNDAGDVCVSKREASIAADNLDADIPQVIESLGIKARNMHRPADTGYSGGGLQDTFYTITAAELETVAAAYGLTVTDETAKPEALRHVLRGRTDALSAVIEIARAKAASPEDYQSVWAALTQLAASKDRPAPLIGYVPGEGIYYEVPEQEDPKVLKKDALRNRMKRAASKG